MKRFFLLSAMLMCMVIFMPAQSDANRKKAAEYQREAEYYQKQAASHYREAEYYLQKAKNYQKEEEYYIRHSATTKHVLIQSMQKKKWINIVLNYVLHHRQKIKLQLIVAGQRMP